MQVKSQLFNFTVLPNSSKTILTWADIQSAYRGSFTIPVGQSGSDEFGYSKAIHTQLSNGNILMVGHVHYQKVRELIVPTNLSGSIEATTVGSWRTITGSTPNGMTTVQIGGLLSQGSLVRMTRHEFYNGTASDWPSQCEWNGSSTSSMRTVPGIHSNYVSGYLSNCPSSLSQFDYLAGQQNMSGAAIGRWGPNFNAIKVGGVSKVLMQHDEAHQYPGWWIANQISSMIWLDLPTKHGVLAFGYRGLSGFGYKANNDPYMGSGGYTATSYEAFCWIYNPQDLLDVLNGIKQPWTLEPIEKKVLTFGNGNETYYTMFRGNPTSNYEVSFKNNRMIVAVAESFQATQYSATPTCYVFNF